MIFKYLILSLLALVFVTSSDPYFGIEFGNVNLTKDAEDDVKEVSWMSTDILRPYLEDKDDRVSDLFKVTPYYYPTVHFWFLMYTKFESSQVVIHDKSNLSLIYKVLDYSELVEKNIPRNTRYVLQQKISVEKVQKLKADLNELVLNPYSLSPEAKQFYRMFKHAGITLPSKKAERVKFLKNLIENMRTQTGQKDFIRAGIIRSMPYQKFLTSYFKSRGLPSELLAVPFLESSFNPRAHSKVSALGIWQFMPLIASYFVPKRTDLLDYRSNVGVSSVAAAFLMSENYKIMKSWDLAITAYNSGTKHLLSSKRKLASSDVDLEDIIKSSDSAFFGFASKNFYSEFLALAHTLAYQEELFSKIHKNERDDTEEMLNFYMMKCSFRLDKVLNDDQLDDVDFHNDQLRAKERPYPRGTIVTSKSSLPKSKFFKIDTKVIEKYKPKDWERLLRNQSCSTK